MLDSKLRITVSLIIAFMIAFHWVNSYAQNTEEKELAFAYYQFSEVNRFIQENGNCSSSTTNFIRVKGAYQSSIRDLDERLYESSEKAHLLETKVIALYGLADCYNQRKSYETAVEYASETINIISKLLSKNTTDLKNKREYIYANERLGLYANDALNRDIAKKAFSRAVSHGEEIAMLRPINYDDNRNLIINYVRLAKVTDEPTTRLEYLKEAYCVSTHILTIMPPEDRDILQGGVLFELHDARQIVGKPSKEIETRCKINPNSSLKELP